MKIAFVALLVLAGGAAVLLAFGRLRWRSATKELRAQLEAAQRPVELTAFAQRDLDRLPAPVQRYLRAVLTEGQKPVTAVDLDQTGTINLSETAEQWKPFTARQRVETHRPGFSWNARIAMMPGVPVFVQDADVGGEGVLRASVCGLVTKADLRERGELVRGELDRFHLVMDAIDRLPQTGDQGLHLKRQLRVKLIEHKQYIDKHGEDLPEIRNWQWSARETGNSS